MSLITRKIIAATVPIFYAALAAACVKFALPLQKQYECHLNAEEMENYREFQQCSQERTWR